MLFPAARAWSACAARRGATCSRCRCSRSCACADLDGSAARYAAATRLPGGLPSAAPPRAVTLLSWLEWFALACAALGSLALLRRVVRSVAEAESEPLLPDGTVDAARALGRRLVALPHVILFAPTLALALVLVVATWHRLPPWTDATEGVDPSSSPSSPPSSPPSAAAAPRGATGRRCATRTEMRATSARARGRTTPERIRRSFEHGTHSDRALPPPSAHALALTKSLMNRPAARGARARTPAAAARECAAPRVERERALAAGRDLRYRGGSAGDW